MKKAICAILVGLLMLVGVFATSTPIQPATDDVTNAATYDFSATTDNPLFSPFRVPTTYLNLEFDGSKEMDCFLNGPAYDCSLTQDISGYEGIYEIGLTDNDGTVSVSNLTIDHTVTANSFNFQATDYDVTYTDGCVDTVSGVSQSIAQFNNGAGWTNMAGSPTTLPAGSYNFRGYCQDNAGNEAYTANTSYILPASPPDLIEVNHLPGSIVCAGGFPCTYAMDGAGSKIDASFKLIFDKAADLTITLNGVNPVNSGGFYDEHVISLTELTNGVHTLSIVASDGTNSDTYIINLDVSNTGASGDVTVNVRGSIPLLPPTGPYIQFDNAPVVEKDNVLEGDFFIIRYSLFVREGNYTRFNVSTAATNVLDVPIQFVCENNYDAVAKDIINPSLAYNTLLNTGLDETQPALSCISGQTGTFDVIGKFPVQINAPEGPLSWSLGYGLYDTPI